MGTNGFFGWAQPLVAQLCHSDPVNARFCLEADAATRHYVALTLRGYERRDSGEFGLTRLSRVVARRPRREVVAAAWGEDLGSMDVLSHCAARLFGRATYDGLAALLADRDRRRALGRCAVISAPVVRTVERADPGLLAALGAELLARLGSDQVAYLVGGVGGRRPDLDRTTIVASLRRCASTGEDVTAWVDRMLAGTRLPAPPWPGTTEIRPIRTPKEMRAAALAFRNCLNNAAHRMDALRGERAYYRCDGDHPAVACIVRDRLFETWRLEEVKGPCNAAVPPRALGRIVAAFRKVGFPHLPDDPTYALDLAA